MKRIYADETDFILAANDTIKYLRQLLKIHINPFHLYNLCFNGLLFGLAQKSGSLTIIAKWLIF